jgi:hypothetical protein
VIADGSPVERVRGSQGRRPEGHVSQWRDMTETATALTLGQAMSWWRWLRTTGCLAGAGLLLALSTVPAGAQQQQPQGEQQPQRECFAVEMTRGTQGGSLGAILLDRCTGKSWVLARASVRGGGYAVRWHPITVESTESVSGGR